MTLRTTNPLPSGMREIAPDTYSFKGWRIDYDFRGFFLARKGSRHVTVMGDIDFVAFSLGFADRCCNPVMVFQQDGYPR